jgi:cytochrome b/b6/petD-like protein
MEVFKQVFNALANPTVYFILTIGLLAGYLGFRKVLTRPAVATAFLLGSIAFFGISMFDPNFRKIVSKPDNVPIVMMLGLVLFLTWVALRRAVVNDDLMKKGEPNLEAKESKERVFVWPDLVYTELISMVICTVALVVWSIELEAPLEQPSAPARTPNPSKAPWYFLGLQEMLVYYDPWIAGVLLPGLIIVGLQAIPYLDRNPKGNGYYTFEERPFAISFYLFGFLILWVSLVVLGTFLRGPNWSFFGPFERWDIHFLEPLVNVNVSEYFWVRGLGEPLPQSALLRELPGLLLILGYFALTPPLLLSVSKMFRGFFLDMGFARYSTFVLLLLVEFSLPIKMVLRWTLNLKYVVAFPEFFFNI